MHLPLLPTRTVEVGFVPRVRGDEHDDASRRAAPGPTATLDRPDLGGDGLVEDDEVHLRNVEAFFADRRGDDHVHLPGLELLEDLDLFLLRQSDVRSEEHTSELQSHSDLVCRLLLEKKNK